MTTAVTTTEFKGLTVGESQLSGEDATKFAMLLAELEDAIENRLPGYRTMLAQVHSILKSDPAQVTILEPDQAAVIVKGLSHARGEVFTESSAKKRKAATPKVNVGSLL